MGPESECARASSVGAGAFRFLVGALVLCGIATRLSPFIDPGQRLLRQFPSEDGYLMLTIARNIGTGLGMSTAAGSIPTDGTQPFVALVWALGFWVLDGDKTSGVAFALAVQLIIAAATAWALLSLGRRLLGNSRRAQASAVLAAAVWFATMLSSMHGMNCLETGTYAFLVVVFVLVFLGREGDPLLGWSSKRALVLGGLLGLIFWVRADAVFLIAAACLCRALLCQGGRFRITADNVKASFLMGAAAWVIAAPWLLYCRIGFGHFMPISGIAQSWDADFGQGATQLAANLAEYVLVIAPIPQRLEAHALTTLASILVIGGMLAAVMALWRRSQSRIRSVLFLVGSYGLGLCAYYGLLFGAPYFMSRYLFPLSPFLALLWAAGVLGLWSRVRILQTRRAAVLASALVVVVVAYPNLRLYRKGTDHMHFQVVEWVESNVPDDVWVGAIQSGTVGFFHDRTINLDGKVNPEALAAARAGEIPLYVLAKPIRYLADWNGIASWAENELLRPHFELIVDDPAHNLAVLARLDRVGSGGS